MGEGSPGPPRRGLVRPCYEAGRLCWSKQVLMSANGPVTDTRQSKRAREWASERGWLVSAEHSSPLRKLAGWLAGWGTPGITAVPCESFITQSSHWRHLPPAATARPRVKLPPHAEGTSSWQQGQLLLKSLFMLRVTSLIARWSGEFLGNPVVFLENLLHGISGYLWFDFHGQEKILNGYFILQHITQIVIVCLKA